MKVFIEAGWDSESMLAQRQNSKMTERAKTRVKETSFTVMRGVKERMPVDTGAARASWGSSPSPAPAEPLDGIWIVRDNGMEIEQGSRRHYISNLNAGSSQQAPPGFIDAEVEKAVNDMEDKLLNDALKIFGAKSILSMV